MSIKRTPNRKRSGVLLDVDVPYAPNAREIHKLKQETLQLAKAVIKIQQDIKQIQYWILIHHKLIDPSAVRLGEYTCCPPELKEFQNDIRTNVGNPGS